MQSAIPSHVQPDVVWDNNFVAFLGELDDPYLAGARLHDGPRVIWATNASFGMPSWIFVSHEAVAEGFANGRKFSSLLGALVLMFIFMKVVYVSLPLGTEPFSAVSLWLLATMGVH